MIVSKRFLSLLFLIVSTVSFIVSAEPIKLASDLYAAATESKSTQTPIVIFTTASDCEYCEVLRENIFQFLTHDPRFILRELVMNSKATLTGFKNQALSHHQFADNHSIYFSPTVLFLGNKGSALADPLIGVLTLDYYRYYFDKNVTTATAKLREKPANSD